MSSDQLFHFLNPSQPPPNQYTGLPTPQPPPRRSEVDDLSHNLEYNFIDIPHLVGDDEDEEELPTASGQPAVHAAPAPPAAPGVVQPPSGFDPAPYQAFLQQRQIQHQQQQPPWAQQAQQQWPQQQQQAQQQPQQWPQHPQQPQPPPVFPPQ